MPEYRHPGVYVEEYEGGVKSIPGVSTSIPHMIDPALARELLAAARRARPDWTDINQSDPGVALLGLVEWLAWMAALPEATVPERGRGAARRAAAILAALADRCAPSRNAPSRLNFFAGQRLDAESLQAEQEYFRGKLRRHNRELHGWGIVRGLGVIVEASANNPGGRVRVEPGYALDPRGDEIIVHDEVSLALPKHRTCLFVSVRHWDRPCAPAPSPGGAPIATRIEEACIVAVVDVGTDRSIAIARLHRSEGQWAVDPEFLPPRAGSPHELAI